MSREFDTSAFVAEVVVQATERGLGLIGDSKIAGRTRRILHDLTDAYAPYLENTYRRVSTVRTFLKPTESFDLLDVYVPVGLTDKDRRFEAPDLIEDVYNGQNFVISALAGRGKSVLMRFLALSMYLAPRGKIPLFLELRALNQLTSKNLLQYLHSQYKGSSSVGLNDFLVAVERGYFVLILDGFDEVSPPERDEIELQILEVARQYERCGIVVSGRNDERFHSWESFKTVHLMPMTFSQTKELISRANYNDEVKVTFLKRLTEDFFQKHESFLETPLLAIMLMLTFEEYAEIPASLHEFYRNAFDTLVRRHDAMKSQFLRKTHSGCTAEEFKRIFSSFCVLTYTKAAYAFSRDSANAFIASAIKQQGLKKNSSEVLDDFIESICLLQEEGFEISFVHRSFQEYFCALFISNSNPGVLSKYLSKAHIRIHDDVLPMLYGMCPDKVDGEWAKEFVEQIYQGYFRSGRYHEAEFLADKYPKWSIIKYGKRHHFELKEFTDLSRGDQMIRRFFPDYFAFIISDKDDRRYLAFDDWMDEIIESLRKMENDGEESLKGFSKYIETDSSDESTRHGFTFPVTPAFEPFFRSVYGEGYEKHLRPYRKIRQVQQEREKGGDEFIKELFSDD